MLRVSGIHSRRLSKIRVISKCRRVEFSTPSKPPTPPAPGGSKKATQPEGGGSSTFGIVSLTLLPVAVVGLVAYKKETDEKFSAYFDSKVPFLNKVIDPVQSAIRKTGIIKPTAKPVVQKEDGFEESTAESAEEIADSLVETYEEASHTSDSFASEPSTDDAVVFIDFPTEAEDAVEKATTEASAVAAEHHPRQKQGKNAAAAPSAPATSQPAKSTTTAAAAAVASPVKAASSPAAAAVVIDSSVESAIAGLPSVSAEARAKRLQSEAVAEVLDDLAIQAAVSHFSSHTNCCRCI
jgi:hypothetical protein